MIVTTESGTRYEFDGATVRRIRQGDSAQMRRDEEWLHYRWAHGTEPMVGERLFLLLEPLGLGDSTLRITTPVTEITE